jgi:hypothetical protein
VSRASRACGAGGRGGGVRAEQDSTIDEAPYFLLSIEDSSSQMRNYLGGSSFTLTLTCGGMTVTQVQGQFTKMQYCEG